MRDIHPDSPEKLNAELDALRGRLVREKRARQAAEALLDAKAEELFAANDELAQVLSGSVKVLADVLAMAKPELFQKAGKVQRWSRQLAKVLQVERPWELDLAAMLYPLGVIALPEEITSKYALDMELTEQEQELVDEGPAAAMLLLENMPRMQGVARAIYYSRKGFDGSGFPHGDVKGDDIPQAARILRILVDLADKATGAGRTRAEAFQQMAEQKHLYDLEILKVCYKLLNRDPAEETGGRRILQVAPTLLRAGDVVHRDIVDNEGHLLLAAGSELSEIGIKRLHTCYIQKGMIEKVHVLRDPGADAAEQKEAS